MALGDPAHPSTPLDRGSVATTEALEPAWQRELIEPGLRLVKAADRAEGALA
jgi:hypothetical protein